jgi:hypothetical protein
VTIRASLWAPDPAGADTPLAADGAVTLVDLQKVWIRHQALAPFHLEYDGRRPMLIFLFSPARPARGGPAFPRGAFRLLLPGRPLSLESAEPTETLAVAFDPPAACGRVRSEDDVSRRGSDPGVRALAHEMRPVLLTEGAQADPIWRAWPTRSSCALCRSAAPRASAVAAPTWRRSTFAASRNISTAG